jgi:hypothetical protein
MASKNVVPSSNDKTSSNSFIFVHDQLAGELSTTNTKGKVLQDWIASLPWKMQSVLISAQRGPDSHFCPHIKSLTKWIRRTCQQNADPAHTFMADVPLPSLDELEYELEYCTMHFTFHLLYGLQIIAYKHPETTVKKKAMFYYKGIIEEILHFNIESEKQMDARLYDKV